MFHLLLFLVLLIILVFFGLSFREYKKDENEEITMDYRCSTRPSIWSKIPEFVQARERANYIQKIPLKIFQTNEPQVLDGMKNSILGWIEKNPEYDYHYFTTEKCRDFISKNFDRSVLRAYDDLIPGAYKADLFRYCVLYKNGGVYLDSCFVCKVPLKEIIKPEFKFVSAVDRGVKNGLYNAFIACTPNNPVIKRAIDLAVSRIETRDYGERDLYTTGPICLGDALSDILKKSRQTNFVPGPYDNGKVFLFDRYAKPGKKIGGIFDEKRKEIIRTKYDCHWQEKSKWSKLPGYSTLWKEKKIFKSDVLEN